MGVRISLLFICSLFLFCACDVKKSDTNTSSIQGRYIVINGKRIYVEEYGSGMPLMLLSGGGLGRSTRDFDKCIPEFAKHYHVIVPDSPGQGGSDVIDTLTYSTLLETTSQLIDSLKIDSAYVMGWSDGGITAIQLAEKRADKIRKAIAVGANNGLRRAIPPGVPIDSVKPMRVDVWARENKETIDAYTSRLPRDWKKLLNDLNTMWYLKEQYFSDSIYSRIKIPVMIVLGDRDDIIVEHGLEMHRAIKGSQFCVLPGTSHEVFKEQPEVISRIAVDFFDK